MFGIWNRKKPTVFTHWYSVVENLEISSEEFYKDIENYIEARCLPGLFVEYIQHAEGGMLSVKRKYLRMRRERLLFDVCSAPFGTYWFFSCRFSEIPLTIKIWEIFTILVVLAA